MTALPKLITFDGEVRSGKGTIAHATKDYLRDECGYKVMLIDAGQVFRVLAVAVQKAGVDVDSPTALDDFLQNNENIAACTQLVKDVYHMSKPEREALLYTNEIGYNSAKLGARPLSQAFKDTLLKKWLRDAGTEGYEVVLLDGRALEETGAMLEGEKLCQHVLGLYFVCDAAVGARRTLGFANTSYDNLAPNDKKMVDEFAAQIIERNRKDRERAVQPIVPPVDAPTWNLPSPVSEQKAGTHSRYIVNTTADMKKLEMALPVARLVKESL